MFKKNFAKVILGTILFFSLVVIILFSVPSLRERVLWRVDQWKIQIDYTLNPPEAAIFVPDADQIQSTTIPQITSTFTPLPSAIFTIDVSIETPTPTLEPTPLPSAIKLDGVVYQDQHGLWNYCAPANLAMQLSYWGWDGDRLDTGTVLKPFEKDKNVMLYEMADYVINNTELQAITRSGGNLTVLKSLIANGFPVLVEKGVFIRDTNGKVSWMGHYAVLNGYDDEKQQFLSQDSYFRPDFPVSYDDLLSQWRSLITSS